LISSSERLAAETQPQVPVLALDGVGASAQLIGKGQRASGAQPARDRAVERGLVAHVVKAHARGDQVEGAGLEGDLFEPGGDRVDGHATLLGAGPRERRHFGRGVHRRDPSAGIPGRQAKGQVAGAAPQFEDALRAPRRVRQQPLGHLVVPRHRAPDERVVRLDHPAEEVRGRSSFMHVEAYPSLGREQDRESSITRVMSRSLQAIARATTS
jgi:hypothetical protein